VPVHRAPGDFPSGKKGDVLTVEFTVMGIPCLGLNGGPAFKHNEAFSFQVATDPMGEHILALTRGGITSRSSGPAGVAVLFFAADASA
jgi:3-demethylubiquinone-9 3-methyltransferase